MKGTFSDNLRRLSSLLVFGRYDLNTGKHWATSHRAEKGSAFSQVRIRSLSYADVPPLKMVWLGFLAYGSASLESLGNLLRVALPCQGY